MSAIAVAQKTAYSPEVENEEAAPQAFDAFFLQAVDAVFDLDERGRRLDVEVSEKPYEALIGISKALRQFGVSNNLADEFVEVIEAQAMSLGVDFTQKEKPTPLTIALRVVDQKPELDPAKTHFMVAWDRRGKYGSDYSSVEAHLTNTGTKITTTNVPQFEDLFKGGGEKYLVAHFVKLEEEGLEGLDQQGAQLATFVEAVGPVAAAGEGGRVIKQAIETRSITPQMSELIQTVATINRTVEASRTVGAVQDPAAIVNVLKTQVATLTHKVAEVQTMPPVIVKAATQAIEQAAPRNIVKAPEISAPRMDKPTIAPRAEIAAAPVVVPINRDVVVKPTATPVAAMVAKIEQAFAAPVAKSPVPPTAALAAPQQNPAPSSSHAVPHSPAKEVKTQNNTQEAPKQAQQQGDKPNADEEKKKAAVVAAVKPVPNNADPVKPAPVIAQKPAAAVVGTVPSAPLASVAVTPQPPVQVKSETPAPSRSAETVATITNAVRTAPVKQEMAAAVPAQVQPAPKQEAPVLVKENPVIKTVVPANPENISPVKLQPIYSPPVVEPERIVERRPERFPEKDHSGGPFAELDYRRDPSPGPGDRANPWMKDPNPFLRQDIPIGGGGPFFKSEVTPFSSAPSSSSPDMFQIKTSNESLFGGGNAVSKTDTPKICGPGCGKTCCSAFRDANRAGKIESVQETARAIMASQPRNHY